MQKTDKTSTHEVFGDTMYHLKCNVCGGETATSSKKGAFDEIGRDCTTCKVCAEIELAKRATNKLGRELTDDETFACWKKVEKVERVVDYKCPDCGYNIEVRKGTVNDGDGKHLYVYRCKECGYMWDDGEYVGDKK